MLEISQTEDVVVTSPPPPKKPRSKKLERLSEPEAKEETVQTNIDEQELRNEFEQQTNKLECPKKCLEEIKIENQEPLTF